MKNFSSALLLLFLLASNSFSAQIVFKSGFFLENNGSRTQCLIRDVDWKSNPVAFDYKMSENDIVQTGKIENIQEFQIEDFPKYVRKNVNIDRWDKYMAPSIQKQPVYKSETLFLKELVGGSAILYEYVDGNFSTYFYTVDDKNLQQLIQKQYVASNGLKDAVYKNDLYKLQLQTDLQSEAINQSDLKNLSYYRNDFMKLFAKFNKSRGDLKNEADERDIGIKLHLTPRIGLNRNNVTADVTFAENSEYKYDFGSKSNLRVGLELEAILPFHRGKWAVAIEPVFTSYKADNNGTEYTDDIDYQAFEMHFGARHYMFLNPKSKIFINASYVYSVDTKNNSYFPERRIFGTPYKLRPHFTLGVGYKYNNISAEFRYAGKQYLVQRDYFEVEYSSFAIILGYTIF